MGERPVCPACREVIGVYEPLLVVGSGPARSSSLAHEPLLSSGEATIVHRSCGVEMGAGDGTLAGAQDASSPA